MNAVESPPNGQHLRTETMPPVDRGDDSTVEILEKMPRARQAEAHEGTYL